MSSATPLPAQRDSDLLTRRPPFNTLAIIPLLILVAALWGYLCRVLSVEWSMNEQYNYGWFVPFLAVYLFWLRWERRPRPLPASARQLRLAAVALPALFLLLPLRLFEVGNPDWRLLGWIHTALVAAVTLLLIWSAGGTPWLRHFLFPIGFFFVAVPWILSIEYPIVQSLMRGIAMVSAEMLSLFGVPAQVEGSLIRVNTGVVGINEACSGIRSLQTAVMIGLLFGELKKLSPLQRVTLVVAAIAIALAANLARALLLVSVAAKQSIPAAEKWHDLAGYSILALVFLGTFIAAAVLDRRPRRADPTSGTTFVAPTASRSSASILPTTIIVSAICWLAVVELSVEAWYRSHERTMQPATRWTVAWPESAAGFRELPIDERVKQTLHFQRGREAAWSAPSVDPATTSSSWVMFFFRWEPGTSTIIRARSHRPDVCLPNAGWRQIADSPIRDYPIATNVALPFRRFDFVAGVPTQPPMYAYAFFCTHEDAVRSEPDAGGAFDATSHIPPAWGIRERVKMVRDGIRNPGQQVLELILLTRQPLGSGEADAQFSALLPNIVTASTEKISSAAR